MNDELIIKNENNKVTKYHILFSFNMNQNKKNYISYTDYSKNDDGNINIYYGKFSNDAEKKIEDLETQEEVDFMNEITKTISEEIKNIQ